LKGEIKKNKTFIKELSPIDQHSLFSKKKKKTEKKRGEN
jgi:hypothetical protein